MVWTQSVGLIAIAQSQTHLIYQCMQSHISPHCSDRLPRFFSQLLYFTLLQKGILSAGVNNHFLYEGKQECTLPECFCHFTHCFLMAHNTIDLKFSVLFGFFFSCHEPVSSLVVIIQVTQSRQLYAIGILMVFAECLYLK